MGCVFHVTVTRLVPSPLTVMKPVSVDVSRASLDLNVTGVHEVSSTFRRADAHVSIDIANSVSLQPVSIKVGMLCQMYIE